MITARLKIQDRKNPSMTLTRTLDFTDETELERYVRDLRRMRYSAKVAHRRLEAWERLMMENIETYAKLPAR
jgi:hypothetical protein